MTAYLLDSGGQRASVALSALGLLLSAAGQRLPRKQSAALCVPCVAAALACLAPGCSAAERAGAVQALHVLTVCHVASKVAVMDAGGLGMLLAAADDAADEFSARIRRIAFATAGNIAYGGRSLQAVAPLLGALEASVAACLPPLAACPAGAGAEEHGVLSQEFWRKARRRGRGLPLQRPPRGEASRSVRPSVHSPSLSVRRRTTLPLPWRS